MGSTRDGWTVRGKVLAAGISLVGGGTVFGDWADGAVSGAAGVAASAGADAGVIEGFELVGDVHPAKSSASTQNTKLIDAPPTIELDLEYT